MLKISLKSKRSVMRYMVSKFTCLGFIYVSDPYQILSIISRTCRVPFRARQ